MRGDDRVEQLRSAINVDVSALEPLAAFYLKLAHQGSPLDIARQVFNDREKLRPVEMTPQLRFSRPDVLDLWRNGGTIPDELRDEFAAWLVNHTTHRREVSECERRLRTSMDAQRKLAESDDENDKRKAAAFGRWHIEHWGVADVPKAASAGLDQPFEKQLMAAVQRHAR
jgi:hypothetical protein